MGYGSIDSTVFDSRNKDYWRAKEAEYAADDFKMGVVNNLFSGFAARREKEGDREQEVRLQKIMAAPQMVTAFAAALRGDISVDSLAKMLVKISGEYGYGIDLDFAMDAVAKAKDEAMIKSHGATAAEADARTSKAGVQKQATDAAGNMIKGRGGSPLSPVRPSGETDAEWQAGTSQLQSILGSAIGSPEMMQVGAQGFVDAIGDAKYKSTDKNVVKATEISDDLSIGATKAAELRNAATIASVNSKDKRDQAEDEQLQSHMKKLILSNPITGDTLIVDTATYQTMMASMRTLATNVRRQLQEEGGDITDRIELASNRQVKAVWTEILKNKEVAAQHGLSEANIANGYVSKALTEKAVKLFEQAVIDGYNVQSVASVAAAVEAKTGRKFSLSDMRQLLARGAQNSTLVDDLLVMNGFDPGRDRGDAEPPGAKTPYDEYMETYKKTNALNSP